MGSQGVGSGAAARLLTVYVGETWREIDGSTEPGVLVGKDGPAVSFALPPTAVGWVLDVDLWTSASAMINAIPITYEYHQRESERKKRMDVQEGQRRGRPSETSCSHHLGS